MGLNKTVFEEKGNKQMTLKFRLGSYSKGLAEVGIARRISQKEGCLLEMSGGGGLLCQACTICDDDIGIVCYVYSYVAMVTPLSWAWIL